MTLAAQHNTELRGEVCSRVDLHGPLLVGVGIIPLAQLHRQPFPGRVRGRIRGLGMLAREAGSIRLFGFQRGVTVASRSQLGLPA